MRLSLVLLLLATKLLAVDLNELEKELKGKGLEGEVHGSTPGLGLYVFVWRNPNDFFDHEVFPLVTKLDEVQEEFTKLGRHDRIKIKGQFATLKAPIRHILVSDISVVKKFEGALPVPAYKYDAKLPKDLIGKSHFVGKVHALVNGGKILVVEYKDAVLPVFVEKTDLIKDLYRNDKIEIYYKIRSNPGSPVHIDLDTSVPTPLKVLDKMVAIHGKKGAIEGNLVLFPKSPMVIFNVFALHTKDADGIEREYTLINFDDPKAFEKIRVKLQEWWDSDSKNLQNIRNKYLNLNVRVKAKGTFNVVDPEQANPQILLEGPQDIELVKVN